jgi:hypothetical protein
MAIRKGAKVKYIGDNELAKDQIFTVRKKTHHLIDVYFPCRYLGGEVHNQLVALPISDFEEVTHE